MARIRRLPTISPAAHGRSRSTTAASPVPAPTQTSWDREDTIVVSPRFRLSQAHQPSLITAESPNRAGGPIATKRSHVRHRSRARSSPLVERFNAPEIQEPLEESNSTSVFHDIKNHTLSPTIDHRFPHEQTTSTTTTSPAINLPPEEQQLAMESRTAAQAEINQLLEEAEAEERKLKEHMGRMKPENLSDLISIDEGESDEGTRRSKKRRGSPKRSAFFKAITDEWCREVEQTRKEWSLEELCTWRNEYFRRGLSDGTGDSCE